MIRHWCPCHASVVWVQQSATILSRKRSKTDDHERVFAMTNLIQPTHNSNRKLAGFGGDIDGFFGLLVDNIIQLLVILTLLKFVIKIPDEIILRQIIPAVGVSVVFGNIFYAAQAWYGSRKEGKRKTALPYGINTPSVFAYLLFIMLPVYLRTDSWDSAYAAGMVACIGSGLIEFYR